MANGNEALIRALRRQRKGMTARQELAVSPAGRVVGMPSLHAVSPEIAGALTKQGAGPYVVELAEPLLMARGKEQVRFGGRVVGVQPRFERNKPKRSLSDLIADLLGI